MPARSKPFVFDYLLERLSILGLLVFGGLCVVSGALATTLWLTGQSDSPQISWFAISLLLIGMTGIGTGLWWQSRLEAKAMRAYQERRARLRAERR